MNSVVSLTIIKFRKEKRMKENQGVIYAKLSPLLVSEIFNKNAKCKDYYLEFVNLKWIQEFTSK